MSPWIPIPLNQPEPPAFIYLITEIHAKPAFCNQVSTIKTIC